MILSQLKPHTALGGFYPALGIVLFFIMVLILLPLMGIFAGIFTLSPDTLWDIFTEDRTLSAFKITLLTAFVATIFNAIFGFLIAWVLVRYDFRGKSMIDAMIDLPFALPTAVAGISLVALYDKNETLGQFLSLFGIEVPYTLIGIIMAMMFTSLPFGVRLVQPVLANLNSHLEEVALTLGASKSRVFCSVIFPQVINAFLKGFSLAFARSLGEFGAVIFIAGNIPFETEVVSLLIMVRLEEFDYAGASVMAFVILMLSLMVTFSTIVFEYYQRRGRNG